MGGPLCRLCNCEAYTYSTVRECQLYECSTCGVVQVHPVPTGDELRSFYSMAYFERGKYRNDRAGNYEQRRRLGLLAQLGAVPGARVLDFGCATGEFLIAAKEVYEVWGADVSAYAIAQVSDAIPELSNRLELASPEGRLPTERLPSLRRYISMGRVGAFNRPHVGFAGACRAAPAKRHTPCLYTGHWRLVGSTFGHALALHNSTRAPQLFFRRPVSMQRSMCAVGLEPFFSSSRGKWANLGFIFYSYTRVFPGIPQALTKRLGDTSVGRLCVYVPSRDVLYAAARKR